MPNCTPKPKKSEYPHVEALIAHFGGAAELSRRLSERNLPAITEDGINKWRWRGSIPMDRLIDLQKLGKIERRPININKYLRHFAGRRAA